MIASRSTAYATAWRTSLLSNGGESGRIARNIPSIASKGTILVVELLVTRSAMWGGMYWAIWTSLLSSAATRTSVSRMTRNTTSSGPWTGPRSEEHTSELQSRPHLVCRLLLEKKNKNKIHCHLLKKKKQKTR